MGNQLGLHHHQTHHRQHRNHNMHIITIIVDAILNQNFWKLKLRTQSFSIAQLRNIKSLCLVSLKKKILRHLWLNIKEHTYPDTISDALFQVQSTQNSFRQYSCKLGGVRSVLIKPLAFGRNPAALSTNRKRWRLWT